MNDLEKVRITNNLTLAELNMAIKMLRINPTDDLEISAKDTKRINDWAIGFHELPF